MRKQTEKWSNFISSKVTQPVSAGTTTQTMVHLAPKPILLSIMPYWNSTYWERITVFLFPVIVLFSVIFCNYTLLLPLKLFKYTSTGIYWWDSPLLPQNGIKLKWWIYVATFQISHSFSFSIELLKRKWEKYMLKIVTNRKDSKLHLQRNTKKCLVPVVTH